ncbi:hypothetical protein D9615_006704 [Tricholomella constricta]|uniref:F-box domain-containing protein n=1 Tax=Tricholomella constricta TaxID=117010 RepID=A0A8H5H7C8_9AGAR|nr:hypothetical protein D9615_006704 [Tricholomella constricta]
MAGLTALPQEIIEDILLHLDPIEVARASECCNFLRLLVYNPNDQALWRELYLQQPFDDPRKCVSPEGVRRADIDWKGTLQRIIRTRTVLCDPHVCRPGERLSILYTLLEMTTNVRPLTSPQNVDDLSDNLLWVAASLGGSSFLDDVDSTASNEEKQLCARLHTYFGITGNDTRRAARARSRAFVYDMRNYRPESDYGPLDSQGRVNWVHVQALHHVVSMHLVDLQEDESFKFAIFPMSLPFTQSVIPPGVDLDKEQDWAGVNGLWRVSFCFCDHRELLRFNESDVDANGNLDISIFEAPDFGEVFRSLDVNLRVVRTTPDANHPNRPIIHFFGEMPSTTSTMTGFVKMTPDKQVQWHFISGDQGEAVWSSLGIHVGGPQALFGVLGSWTTVFHDSDDPVGPFWLRRQTAAIGLPMNHVSLNVTHG